MTNNKELAIAHSWYFANLYYKLDIDDRKEVIMNIAHHWMTAKGYESMAVPINPDEPTFRQFCMDCISDLSFDSVSDRGLAA